jgi:hypothetical protein
MVGKIGSEFQIALTEHTEDAEEEGSHRAKEEKDEQ